MRKRHRWIDKRRHRKALGILSPRELEHAMNEVSTLMPYWQKEMSKAIRCMVREIQQMNVTIAVWIDELCKVHAVPRHLWR